MSFNGSGTFQINSAGQPVVTGTVISSTAFNALTADLATGLSTCVTKDGQTNPTANLPMAGYKLTGLGNGSANTDSATLGQVQSNTVSLIGSISGTNTITGSLSPAIAAYTAGQMFWFVAANANTGATTININSLGAKSITKNGSTALAASDIKAGQTVVIVYDGTQFQLVGSSLAGITTSAVTALGVNAGDSVTSGTGNTAMGYDAGTAITTGNYLTAIGYNAGAALTSNIYTTVVGAEAGSQYAQSSNNYFGYAAGRNMNSGSNCGFGFLAVRGIGGGSSTGTGNAGFGNETLSSVTTGDVNTAIGNYAGDVISTGSYNSVVGYAAGGAITTGSANTLIGFSAGGGISTGNNNAALGDTAYSSGNYSNSTCLGYSSSVDGSNQVQAGNSSTTLYYYAATQRASDSRDKADIQDTTFGLDFIMKLRPRMYRWDMREDYRTKPPVKPSRADYADEAAYEAAVTQWQADYANWETANSLANLTHDGTHKRNRLHQGLIAQELKQVMDEMGVDFAGYQDFKVDGGDDRLTIVYNELITPMIKAIQELKADFDAYKASHP